jgi:hypothetical protein
MAALLAGCSTPNSVQKPGYQIVKVNRTLFDTDGHETDVVGDLKGEAIYQFHLRDNPSQQAGARFHIKWKAPDKTQSVKLRLDVRGLTAENLVVFDTLSEEHARMDGWAEWSTLDIAGERFKRLGIITAWKVSVFAGGELKAELPSGNWYGNIKADMKQSNN